MNIGERLRKLRINAKLSLKEMGAIFNVALNTIYRWEHNLCLPRKKILKHIAEYYDVSFGWLINGNSETDDTDGETCDLNPESGVDRKILKMLRKLSTVEKYRILGYIERICVENEAGKESEY